MSPRIALSLLLASVVAACAHAPRPEELTARYEHSFSQPLDTALARARGLLEERGYSFQADDVPDQLVTDWRTPAEGDASPAPAHRYLVVGIRVSDWRSAVRFFKQERTATGHGAGTRDLELERQLTVRLEARPGGEVALGHLVEPAPSPVVRDVSFYLERWKHADVALDALCPRQVKGLGELLRPGQTVLVGEQLGSREAPAVVGDMVCEALEAGIPLALGLSIPANEQERINQYLSSPGAPADQDALLRGPFWLRPYQDGRSSRAVMDLLDRMRALRAAGRLFSVVAYDAVDAQGNEREAFMAGLWLKRRASHPEELFLVLSGNTHTRTVRGTEWDATFTPMGWHLRRADPGVKSLDLSYAAGRTWGCNLKDPSDLVCGIVRTSPSARVAERPGLSPYVRLNPVPTEEGYHGLLYVGALHPSLPATEVDRRAEQEPPTAQYQPPPPPKQFFTPPPPRNASTTHGAPRN